MRPVESGQHRESHGQAVGGNSLPQSVTGLRIAVGLGDPEREGALLSSLTADGDLVVGERCLSADQLLHCVRGEHFDAVLLAEGLHRLTATALADLSRLRVPLVLLTSHPEDHRRARISGLVLPVESDPNLIRQALLAAIRGERSLVSEPTVSAPIPTVSAKPEASSTGLSVIALASGPGSPGRTTVALNLAAALGAVAPTVLVDADLSGPSVAAHIDADPTRNLYMLAHGEPETDADWSRGIEQETQRLADRRGHGHVLCGLPKVELRSGITSRFLERLVPELRRRFTYVVFDVGSELLSREAAAHRAALQHADHVLFVVSADLIGLWHGRTGLDLLPRQIGIQPDRTALVINRHDRRLHHGLGEIEWSLGLAATALIPNDHAGTQRALAEQQPMVFMDRGPATRALLNLAERVHGGTISVPLDPPGGRLGWLRRAIPIGRAGRHRFGRIDTPGSRDEHDSSNTARTPAGRLRSDR